MSAGSVDLGIVAYPVKRSGLEVLPFREDRLVLICAPDHPLANKSEVRVEQLDRERFIAFEKDVPTRRAVDRILRSHGCQAEIVMEFDNIETIKRAVEIEAGVSIVPQLTVASEARTGTLRIVPFAGKGYVRQLGILLRRGRARTQVMDRFLALLKEDPPVSTDLV
ncbi:MAG: LysR family transcriptional regulator substrate-binding protein [Candidatus Eisenbacteria bacterium]